MIRPCFSFSWNSFNRDKCVLFKTSFFFFWTKWKGFFFFFVFYLCFESKESFFFSFSFFFSLHPVRKRKKKHPTCSKIQMDFQHEKHIFFVKRITRPLTQYDRKLFTNPKWNKTETKRTGNHGVHSQPKSELNIIICIFFFYLFFLNLPQTLLGTF